MIVTKQDTAEKILLYLNHTISLNELVIWAEDIIQKAVFEEGVESTLREVVGSLGLIDVRNFGLLWEDCEKMMSKLGFKIKIEAMLAA